MLSAEKFLYSNKPASIPTYASVGYVYRDGKPSVSLVFHTSGLGRSLAIEHLLTADEADELAVRLSQYAKVARETSNAD
jgi:hypothetical protein